MSYTSEYGGCQSRVCREGWTGRRRNYKCRECGTKFQHDGRQLPARARYCLTCRKQPQIKQAFDNAFEEDSNGKG